MKPFDAYLPMWVWCLFCVTGFGVCAWQMHKGTYQTKRPYEKKLRTVRRVDAPWGWFFSTFGWFLIGGLGLAAIVFRAVR